MIHTKPIINLRTYTIKVRKMPIFLKAFEELALPVLVRHSGKPLGMYTSMIGTLNQFVHLWEYDSLAEFERGVAGREKDPDWIPYVQATLDIIDKQEDCFIKAVNFKA